MSSLNRDGFLHASAFVLSRFYVFSVIGVSWGALGALLGALRALLGTLVASWGALAPLFAALGSLLGRSWRVLGRSWGAFGRILGRLGGILGKISKKGRVRSVFWSHFGTQNGGQNHQKSLTKSKLLFKHEF